MTNQTPLTISVHELKKRLDDNPELCIIDVREPDEWEEVRIPCAHLIPKDRITDQIETVKPDKSCPVYLHCRGGVRSLQAASRLINMGYQEVYSIEGGIAAWESNGYPVEKQTNGN